MIVFPNGQWKKKIAFLSAILISAGPLENAAGSEQMRGMTVSCPIYGEIWAGPHMKTTLGSLRALGVNWVAIHPYARIKRDGSVSYMPAGKTSYLRQGASLIQKAGHRFFLKPHLAYWGSFSWRGAIAFDREESWRRFFASYRAFILDQAAFAESQKVPLFAVGVELDKTLGHEAEWRSVIRDVRRVYHGKITYAANWDQIHNVPFWDELDYIGVQAYFPLEKAAAPESREPFQRAWSKRLNELSKLSAKAKKKIIFTEIGYARHAEANRKPWLPGNDDSPSTVRLRTELMKAAFSALDENPLVAGVFWWKWIPGDARNDRDFSMKDRESLDVLRTYWSKKKVKPDAKTN